ncbi:uncharacterized protein LOC131887243 [Tigriopus californicus]|uniref:uncharacterized protein LOC131887243 n=1 Tax=Tigriopus californicus TaxID=6832 RepID=UPI0027DA1505|nr:uncharacterized protein LOC131887243 [Tigriopus californicus]
MKALILFSFLLCLSPSTFGLRFAHEPVTVDTDVLIVGKPARLTCNFVKYRTESVREITWFLGYSGFRTKIFGYAVSTGVKEGSNFPFVSVDEHSVTDSELTITLTDFRDENMTLGCEVEVIRDNGYGKLRHDKKLGNSIVKAVDNGQHQLILKADPGLQNQAIPDKEVVVSCVSQGANPPPKLSLMVDGRNLTEIYTGTVQEGVVPDQKEVNLMGRIERLPEHLFKNSYLTIECLAHFDDFLFAKKEISLQKRDAMSSPSSIPNYDEEQKSRYMRPGANRRNDVDDSNGYLRPGMIPQDSGSFGRTGRVDEGYQADVIHSKLLDLMDPARHIHPGIPYDFFAGYLLMVSDEVNPTVEGNGHTTILGELPYEVETALHRHYGRVNQVTHEKTQIKMDPIKVLNIMGGLGYRVIGQSDQGNDYVWTLEKKNFEMANAKNHQSHN